MEQDEDKALSLVHQGWDHLRRQRPLAAWAAWQRALRVRPGDLAAEQALEILESAEELPISARTTYRFRAPRQEDRGRWNDRLRGRDLSDLEAAAAAFEELDDASARYNQALCLAWLGGNVEAIVALDRVVNLEARSDPDFAVAAWTLAEVLRQGAGAESLADDLDYALVIPWNSSVDEIPLPNLRPTPQRPEFPDCQTFEWLDRPIPTPDEVHSAGDLPRVLASLVVAPGSIRLSSPDPFGPDVARARFGLIARSESAPLPLALADAPLWTFRLPSGLEESKRLRVAREAVEHGLEDVWIHVPRQGLDGRSPLEAGRASATGDAVARAKLLAVIRHRERLADRPRAALLYQGYPFDRLRRRVGLAPANSGTSDPNDYACMSGDELDQIVPNQLDDFALLEAVRSADGLRDPIRTARFAAALAQTQLRSPGPNSGNPA